jgi:hypothetical protein
MKNFTKVIGSVLLIGSMALSVAGCAGFNAITAKEYKSAIKAATDLKSSDIRIEEDTRVGKADVNTTLRASEGKCYYGFIEFEDAEDAADYFEDEVYDGFLDMIEDKDFDGNYRETYSKSAATGYILVDGEGESDNDFNGDVYGGVFLKDNTIVIAMATSGKNKDKDKIDAVLDQISYPKP